MSAAQEIVDYDWTISTWGNVLHHVALPPDIEDVDDIWHLGPSAAACGRKLKAPRIPGIFTRMGAMRCDGCCRALGIPPGKGSPKNDDECRRILGWEPSAVAAERFRAQVATRAQARPTTTTGESQ